MLMGNKLPLVTGIVAALIILLVPVASIAQNFNATVSNCTNSTGGNMTFTFNNVNSLGAPGGNGTLTVIYHGDLDGSTEVFDLEDENNNVLATSLGTPGNQCTAQGTSVFTIPLTDLINWASDGIIEFETIGGTAISSGICNCNFGGTGASASYSVTMELDYPTVSGPNDAGVTSVDTSLVTCKGLTDVNSVIKNYGTNQLNNVQVNWSVDGVVQPPFMLNSTLDTLNGTGSTDTSLTIGQYDFSQSGIYDVKVWTTMPNGVPDTSNFNDTTEVQIEADLIDLQVAEMEDVSCHGGVDGYVKVMSNGYSPTYIWSSGATGDSVTNLWAEPHLVVATDSVSCPDTLEVVVNEPPLLEVNLLEGGSVPCYGDNLGMVSVEGQGGVGNYTYYWGNGSTDSTRNNLNVNTTHNVTVTDGNGCQATASYTIYEPEELEVVTESYNQNAGCENQIGLISVSAGGGTSPYSYMWSNGSTSSGLSNLSGGDYTVTITDDNGCTAIETYPVYDLDVSITNLTPTLMANLSGASYQWINCDDGSVVDGATSDTFTPEENGNYAVVITSGNCTDTSQCVEVLNTSKGDVLGSTKEFNIYPNPTNGNFTMSFGSSADNVEFEIFNAQGSVVKRRVIGNVQQGQQVVENIDASPGIYFVRTISDGSQTITRLVLK